jgi:hypothetical protein
MPGDDPITSSQMKKKTSSCHVPFSFSKKEYHSYAMPLCAVRSKKREPSRNVSSGIPDTFFHPGPEPNQGNSIAICAALSDSCQHSKARKPMVHGSSPLCPSEILRRAMHTQHVRGTLTECSQPKISALRVSSSDITNFSAWLIIHA